MRSPEGSQLRTCLDRGPSLIPIPQPSSEGPLEAGVWPAGDWMVAPPWGHNYSPGGIPWWSQGMSREETSSWVFNVEEMMGLPGPKRGRPHPRKTPKSRQRWSCFRDFYRETSAHPPVLTPTQATAEGHKQNTYPAHAGSQKLHM